MDYAFSPDTRVPKWLVFILVVKVCCSLYTRPFSPLSAVGWPGKAGPEESTVLQSGRAEDTNRVALPTRFESKQSHGTMQG